jgi:hypothetical protein
MAALPQVDPIEMLLDQTVKAVPVPKGVLLRRIYFDTDSTGDPAIYIVYAVSRRLGIAPAAVRSIGTLENAVSEAVEALHLDRIVYVRFEDAP